MKKKEEVILRDQKRIVVDAIVRYMIKDPLKFFQTTRTELALNDRLGRIINSSVRGVIAQYELNDLLSDKRNVIMAEIFENVREDQDNFGIEIVDLRLKRTELTTEVQSNVFDRMRTEREREANLLRAEGQELSQKIKATADREKIEIIAEAEKQSNILKGEGEAARNTILNDAFSKDPEFTPILIEQLLFFAAEITSAILSFSPMLPGFILKQSAPFSAASIALL